MEDKSFEELYGILSAKVRELKSQTPIRAVVRIKLYPANYVTILNNGRWVTKDRVRENSYRWCGYPIIEDENCDGIEFVV